MLGNGDDKKMIKKGFSACFKWDLLPSLELQLFSNYTAFSSLFAVVSPSPPLVSTPALHFSAD